MFAKYLLLMLLLALPCGAAASDRTDMEAVEEQQRALLAEAKALLLERARSSRP